MTQQVVRTTVVAQAKTAKANNNINESATCAILATNGVTGQPFSRAFATYNALEQWLATQAEASNLDLTNIRIVGASGF